MAIHHDNSQEDAKVISKGTFKNVTVIEVEKEVISPVMIPVKIEKPVFIEKEYEKPIIVEKEYEKPIYVETKYARPVFIKKEYEVPILIEKIHEKPVIVEREYEKPVITEKEYEKPIIVEKEYELPVVAAEELKRLINDSKVLLWELSAMTKGLKEIIAKVNATIPDQIKIPKIVYEEVKVKDVKIINETITVIGKVITRGK